MFCFICTFFVTAGLPGILSSSGVTTAEVVTTPLRQALSTCASATEGIVFVDQYIFVVALYWFSLDFSFLFIAGCGFVVGEGDSDFSRSPVIMTPRQMETLGRRIAVEVKASVEPVAAGTYSIFYVVILILFVGRRIL